MGESVDAMEEDMGTSSKGENLSNGFDMDIDMNNDDDYDCNDDVDFMELNSSLREMGEEGFKEFCERAATSFFKEYGLISHQINSYNYFSHNGLQKAFDSFKELVVEPGYDPSKKGENE